ncbi:MAG: hypothetical protein M9918_18050 [Anaerolineae bacterium]|nr:hypothetical protein [Anaerolineae bacterium]MCO5195162.1 hypothetical protein [Anaerolineae bacterium]
MKRIRYLLIVAAVAIGLAACGRQPEPETWIGYESEVFGLTFEVPQSWIVREEAGALAVANSPRTLDEDVRYGAAITFLTGSTSELGLSDPQQLLQLFVDAFTVGTDVEVLEEIRPMAINTYDGATTTMRGTIGGQSGLFRFLIVRDDDQIALLLVSTGDGDRYDETVDRIVNSLQLTP